MNWDIVEGNWKQFKGTLKVQWGNYTDNHFDVRAGKRLHLAGQIQADSGVTRDEAEQQMRRFAKCNKDYRRKSAT
ncbi:MAG: CsbD family protein [Sterolibacterium sp.]|nr:CsbD family protein [Sterolibacterium sp.]